MTTVEFNSPQPQGLPMRQRQITGLFFACCIMNGMAFGAGRLEIQSVNARLFLGHTGSLSAPLTAKDPLWNTIIGEGSAHEPSHSTLVDVVVRGAPGEFDPNWMIDLVVTNGKSGALLSKHSQRAGILSDNGEYHVAFWLAETGCVPLHIVATIRKTSDSKETRVDFACGE
jgi:hypothetical protein